MRALALAGPGLVAALTLSACAAARPAQGVFDSPKGYRVTLPGGGWDELDPDGLDLALRHRESPATIVVHATCEPAVAGRAPEVLLRHVTVGLADRRIVEHASTTVAGLPAARAVLEGRAAADGEPARVEALVVRGARCVYDLVYAARPEVFQERRADFGRLVESLALR